MAIPKSAQEGSWILPFVAMFGVAGSAAYTYSSGILMVELVREFGWTRTEFSAALTMQMLMGLVFMPIAGRVIDRVGPRLVILAGIVPMTGAFSLFGLMDGQLWQLWLFAGLLALTLATISPVGWYTAVVRSFDDRRGLALAIALAGIGLAAAIWPILAATFVSALGWRLTFPALALSWSVVALPLVFFYFHPPGISPPEAGAPVLPPLGPVLRSRTFLCLLGAGGLFSCVSLGLTVHLVSILNERGIGLGTAAGIAGIVGISSIVGRVGTGFLLDRVPTRRLAVVAFCMILPAIALLAVGGDSVPLMMIAAAVIGLSAGAESDVVTYLTSRRFDIRQFGSVIAVFQVGLGIFASTGPLLAGQLYDRNGDYSAYLLTIVPLVLLATVLIVLIPNQDSAKQAVRNPA